VNVPIVPYAPGIFETTAFGPRQAVALHASDGSYVTPTNPAHHGENIIIYLTGLGQTTPATGTNQAGLANQQLANTNIYAGLNNSGVPTGPVVAAPGLVGVYTLTLTVPNNAPTGNVPLNVVEYDSANNPYYAQGSFLPIQ
jgi:uncharacterized protein (TIGR03437 family)